MTTLFATPGIERSQASHYRSLTWKPKLVAQQVT